MKAYSDCISIFKENKNEYKTLYTTLRESIKKIDYKLGDEINEKNL